MLQDSNHDKGSEAAHLTFVSIKRGSRAGTTVPDIDMSRQKWEVFILPYEMVFLEGKQMSTQFQSEAAAANLQTETLLAATLCMGTHTEIIHTNPIITVANVCKLCSFVFKTDDITAD